MDFEELEKFVILFNNKEALIEWSASRGFQDSFIVQKRIKEIEENEVRRLLIFSSVCVTLCGCFIYQFISN